MTNRNTTIQQDPGLRCPDCTFNIQVDITMLLSGRPIACPRCGLRLSIDRRHSQEGLNALGALQKGMAEVKQKEQQARAFE